MKPTNISLTMVLKNHSSSYAGSIRAPLTFLQALVRGYVPMTLSLSKLSTLPVDVLIDENGNCRGTLHVFTVEPFANRTTG